MKSYTLTLRFTNLDNFMGTPEQAAVVMQISADNYSHAVMLAQRLCNVMGADLYDLE